MKAMISQPLAGKTDEEIQETRERAIKALEKRGYEVINTLFKSEWYSRKKLAERGVVTIPLCFLAKSIEQMCTVHAVYFVKGWQDARGCRIEHEAATAYGVPIIYEEEMVEVHNLDAEHEFMREWAQKHPIEYAQGTRPLPAFKKKVPLSSVIPK